MRRSILLCFLTVTPILFSSIIFARTSAEVLSFDAIRNGKKIDLTWESTNSIKSSYSIEKSKDGVTWEEFISVEGASKSILLSYLESDFKPSKGISYYRLKQEGDDGSVAVSASIPVMYLKRPKLNTNMFPSEMAKSEFDTNIVKGKKILLVLRGINGEEIHSKVILNIEEGELVGKSAGKKIPKGTYLISATENDYVYAKRVRIK